jgi:hypothetical protein
VLADEDLKALRGFPEIGREEYTVGLPAPEPEDPKHPARDRTLRIGCTWR